MSIAPLQLPGGFQSPTIDWSPLANLGKVYQDAQAKAMKEQALQGAQLDGSPQSLSALATKLLPYDQQGAMTLAQLANTATNRQQDVQWRQAESQRAQQNADRSFGLQAAASARASEGPLEKASQRAAAAGQYGIQQGTPEFKAFVLTGELPAQNTTVNSQVEQRKVAADGLGLKPDNPGYQSFVLTGKMPREDAQPLTATDKKAILEADEGVMNSRNVITALDEASKISKDAFTGVGASGRAKLGNALPDYLVPDVIASPKGSAATANYENLVLGQALSQLKSTFGAAPTEGERKILLELQASADKPDNVRQDILKRARGLAENRLKFNESRSSELRGGSFYKPGAKSAQSALPSQGSGADTMLGHAREALAAGAPRDAVLQRLQAAGIDPSAL